MFVHFIHEYFDLLADGIGSHILLLFHFFCSSDATEQVSRPCRIRGLRAGIQCPWWCRLRQGCGGRWGACPARCLAYNPQNMPPERNKPHTAPPCSSSSLGSTEIPSGSAVRNVDDIAACSRPRWRLGRLLCVWVLPLTAVPKKQQFHWYALGTVNLV